MAQVTIYLPDEVARDVRARAKRAGMSLSAYVTALASQTSRAAAREWPKDFLKLLGSWEGAFPVPDDPPPRDDVDAL